MLRVAFIAAAIALSLVPADDPPREWIEATGHRVVRLSDQPGTASLYFHQNPYTATGDKMVVSTPQGLATIPVLRRLGEGGTLATRTIAPFVEGRVSDLVVGRKTRQAFYLKNDVVYATNIDTGETRKILEGEARLRTGSGFGLSADEKLLAGSFEKKPRSAAPTPPRSTQPPQNPLATPPPQESNLEARLAEHRPMALYTIDIATGELKIYF